MSKTKKTKNPKTDIPFEIVSTLEASELTHVEATVGVDPIRETLESLTSHAAVLLQKYLIADQSDMCALSWAHQTPEFNVDHMKHYNPDVFYMDKRWLLIYNDLANKLEDKNEMVLRNKYGTWWLVNLKEDESILHNKILLEIVKDTLDMSKEQTSQKH